MMSDGAIEGGVPIQSDVKIRSDVGRNARRFGRGDYQGKNINFWSATRMKWDEKDDWSYLGVDPDFIPLAIINEKARIPLVGLPLGPKKISEPPTSPLCSLR